MSQAQLSDQHFQFHFFNFIHRESPKLSLPRPFLGPLLPPHHLTSDRKIIKIPLHSQGATRGIPRMLIPYMHPRTERLGGGAVINAASMFWVPIPARHRSGPLENSHEQTWQGYQLSWSLHSRRETINKKPNKNPFTCTRTKLNHGKCHEADDQCSW